MNLNDIEHFDQIPDSVIVNGRRLFVSVTRDVIYLSSNYEDDVFSAYYDEIITSNALDLFRHCLLKANQGEYGMIITCTCEHRFQDERYGVGRRYANRLKTPDKVRCTVCGVVHVVDKDGKQK